MSAAATDDLASLESVLLSEPFFVLSGTGVVHRRERGPSAACGLADDVVLLGRRQAQTIGVRACQDEDCFGDGAQTDRRPPYEGVEMQRVTLRVPLPLLRSVESEVEAGLYPNRSEAIRGGLRREFGTSGGGL